MCTVSWLRAPDGIHLFHNRDEKLTRGIARPPAVHIRDGVRYVAPSDSNHGGSWIAANEHGVAICLLNGRQPANGRVSRGWIIPALMGARATGDAIGRLKGLDLGAFAPFILLLIDAAGHRLMEWDGESLWPRTAAERILASSSLDFDGVHRRRLAQFAGIPRPTPSTLEQFHRSHVDGPSAWSPCMHRPGAATVSFTHVQITDTAIACRYCPDAPCRNPRAVVATLGRVA